MARLDAVPSNPVETVHGAEDINRRARDSLAHATEQVMAFDLLPYTNPYLDEPAAEAPVQARGVKIRVRQGHDALAMPGRRATVATGIGLGELARALRSLTLQPRTHDRTAVVPLPADQQDLDPTSWFRAVGEVADRQMLPPPVYARGERQ